VYVRLSGPTTGALKEPGRCRLVGGVHRSLGQSTARTGGSRGKGDFVDNSDTCQSTHAVNASCSSAGGFFFLFWREAEFLSPKKKWAGADSVFFMRKIFICILDFKQVFQFDSPQISNILIFCEKYRHGRRSFKINDCAGS